MKNVFALIGLLIASSVSFVHTADTSWDVLMQDKTLKIDAPVVFMGHAVDYTFVCVDGNMLRTKKAVAQRETIFIGKNREVCKDKVVSGTYPTTVNVKEIWAQDFSEEFVELFAGLQEISEIAETNLELKISSRAVRQMSSQLANSEAYGL